MTDVGDKYQPKKFSVENSLVITASSWAFMPVEEIYNEDAINEISFVKNCHLYMIGRVPSVSIDSVTKDNLELIITANIGGELFKKSINVGFEFNLVTDENGWYLRDDEGRSFAPDQGYLLSEFNDEYKNINFEVLYVGQAYGNDGGRNAIDRLRKHEKLLQILIQDKKKNHEIKVLLLGINEHNTVVTSIDPKGSTDDNSQRFDYGLSKAENTSEIEKVSLFEACFIRYFQPRYNKLLKDSFPSTNIKVLNNCYRHDLVSIVAEMSFFEIPYLLFSEKIKQSKIHFAYFDLHKEVDRRQFFFLQKGVDLSVPES